MTEQDYDRARADLGTRKDAKARWDQELAALFIRSGWTQEQLAKKEGKSPSHLAKMLRFGRFLSFCSIEQFPKNLTEGRFRDYWQKTEGNNERQRFAEVQKLIAADLALRVANRPKIGKAIVEKFRDGKWHSPETIAKALETTADHVEATFHNMLAHETYDTKCERKQVGKGWQYRIFPNSRMISSEELTTKLGPILDGLKVEGKKNTTTASPATVAHLAGQLQKLIDEWTK